MYVFLLVLIAHLSNIIPAEISFYFSWGDLGSDNCWLEKKHILAKGLIVLSFI